MAEHVADKHEAEKHEAEKREAEKHEAENCIAVRRDSLIDIGHLELVSDRRMSPGAAREVGEAFARELEHSLGDRAGERLRIERLLLDAPHAQLVSGRGLRQLARSTAQQLRVQVWGE